MEKKNIIIACDSYKGCLSSREVNATIAEALADNLSADVANNLSADVANNLSVNNFNKSAHSQIQIPNGFVQIEMSDGGEGMLDAFLAAMGGNRQEVRVHDALMRGVDAAYGLSGGTAVVEIAQAAGLALVEKEQRNPMRTTSWGVGEIVMDAYRRGVRRFIVGLGGSATSDCGIGMLRAIGDDWHKLREECEFVLASDVVNPLCGTNGAAHVFAPQKGADAEMVEALDLRAKRFAAACARHFGYDRSGEPGAGAAGGLGYAFMQFFNARQESGAELLLQLVGFDTMLRDACLVITGEGHSDRQTLMGKLPMRILEHSKRSGVPVWLVSGGVDDEEEMMAAGFSHVVAVTPKDMELSEAMRKEVAKGNVSIACGKIYNEKSGNP